MSGQALVTAWLMLGLAAGYVWRPRVRLDLPPAEALGADRAELQLTVSQGRLARIGAPFMGLFTRFGAAICRRLGLSVGPITSGRVGALIAFALALLPFSIWLALLLPSSLWFAMRVRARTLRKRLDDQLTEELPEVIGLLLLAASSGLSCLASIRVVTQRCNGAAGQALARAHRQIELGAQPNIAFAELLDKTGEPLRPITAALLAALREGTPLGPALQRVGDESRRLRRRRAEELARRVPIKLLFPLVLCTLPAFALLTVVPLLVSALGSIQS